MQSGLGDLPQNVRHSAASQTPRSSCQEVSVAKTYNSCVKKDGSSMVLLVTITLLDVGLDVRLLNKQGTVDPANAHTTYG